MTPEHHPHDSILVEFVGGPTVNHDSPSWLTTDGGILVPGEGNTEARDFEGDGPITPPLEPAASTRLWTDINYLARCTGRTAHRAEIEAFEVVGDYPDGSPMLRGHDDPDRDRTSDPNRAETFLCMAVDWQGCSNVNFEAEGPHHFCTKGQLANLGTLLTRIHSWAAEIIPAWEG